MQLTKPPFKISQWVFIILFSISIPQLVYAQSSTPPSGSGTSGDPYLITSLDNLYWLSQNSTEWDKYYEQTADIDASSTSTWDSGAGFSPIGNSTTNFTGSYYGGDYTISGLTINRPTTDSVGFFGYTYTAAVGNLGLMDVSITGNDNTGGMFGISDTTTHFHLYTTGTVTGNSRVGGLAGQLIRGYLAISYSEADAVGDLEVGGLVGKLDFNNSTSSSTIEGAYATGSVTAHVQTAGGLVGQGAATKETTFVINSYATGNVASPQYVGGLMGGAENVQITNSYSSGQVSGDIGFSPVGGFVGINTDALITNSYWNIETSGLSDAFGSDASGNTHTVTGLTSEQMRNSANFGAFDFVNFWTIEEDSTSPYLQAIIPETLPGTVVAPEGSGTELDPYQIATLSDLYWLSQTSSEWDKYYIQTADIDASTTSTWDSGAGFTPIGIITDAFGGNYDGDGYSISGLTINRPTTDYVGLFGYTYNATIDNLVLSGASVTGEDYVGGLVGYSFGSSHEQLYTDGTITGETNVGGIAGKLQRGTITAGYSGAAVTGTTEAGGLIGMLDDNSDSFISTIESSYATGTVTATNSGGTGGGLIGSASTPPNVSIIRDSYATGTVNADIGGGFIGIAAKIDISDSYSTGQVSGSNAGGFAGFSSQATITDSYWNTESSGLSTGIAINNNSQTVTGLTSNQMLYRANFSGFDFNTTDAWEIINGFTEPFLRAFQPDTVNGLSVSEYHQTPSGSGISGDPYQIATLGNLYWLSESDSVWSASFIQTADINASETAAWYDSAGFSPIGTTTTNFTGTYDGDGYTISGLIIDRETEDYIGLFGYGDSTSITNLSLLDAEVSGNGYVGALAGFIQGASILTSNYATGEVTSANTSAYIGGLIGILTGSGNYEYSDLGAHVRVSSSGTTSFHIGGLIGSSSADLSSGYAIGDVNAEGFNVGGLIGFSSGNLTNSYSTGNVVAGQVIGGLVGSLSGGSIESSYATGNVSGDLQAIGGLVGTSTGIIEDSYALGDISGDSQVGGFLGNNNNGTVIAGYSTGTITANTEFGAFIGSNSSGGTISGGFWDTETSGLLTGIGFDVNSQTVTGLTSAQMTDSANFSGFDFDSTWSIRQGVTFPYLLSVIPETLPGVESPIVDIPSGSGSPADPYQIATLEHLNWLSQNEAEWDKYYTQTADIDASVTTGWNSGTGFSPIGNFTNKFTGTYNGGGYTLSGLTIVTPDDSFVGLFGVADSASFDQVSLVDVSITGNNSVGGLIGFLQNRGSVTSSNTSGTIAAIRNAGGLIGTIQSSTDSLDSFTGNYSSANVSTEEYKAGGLIGEIVVHVDSRIRESYATGEVSGENLVGGLIGNITPGARGHKIIDSYATGNVTATGEAGSFFDTGIAGGLIGESLGAEIRNSYASGNVTGVDVVGGLVGHMQLDITNSYATGDVTGEGYIGGLVGHFNSSTITLSNSFSSGEVSETSGTGTVGGLIGENSGAVISNVYWNIESSNTTTAFGFDNNSQSATGLTTAEMIDSTNFVGFDFANVWGIHQGYGYPYLEDLSHHRIAVTLIDGAQGWRTIGHNGQDVSYGELLEPLWTQGFTGADSETGWPNVYTYDGASDSFDQITSADDMFGYFQIQITLVPPTTCLYI